MKTIVIILLGLFLSYAVNAQKTDTSFKKVKKEQVDNANTNKSNANCLCPLVLLVCNVVIPLS